jgi:hypothetical protein
MELYFDNKKSIHLIKIDLKSLENNGQNQKTIFTICYVVKEVFLT